MIMVNTGNAREMDVTGKSVYYTILAADVTDAIR